MNLHETYKDRKNFTNLLFLRFFISPLKFLLFNWVTISENKNHVHKKHKCF